MTESDTNTRHSDLIKRANLLDALIKQNLEDLERKKEIISEQRRELRYTKKAINRIKTRNDRGR